MYVNGSTSSVPTGGWARGGTGSGLELARFGPVLDRIYFRSTLVHFSAVPRSLIARSPSSVLESLAGSAEGGFLARSLGGIGGGTGGRALSFDDDRSDSGEDEAGFLRLQEQIKRHHNSKKGAAHAAR